MDIEMLLESHKETDNKLRWDAHLAGGSVFELYIPKEQVPEPWPGRIQVTLGIAEEEQVSMTAPRTSLTQPIETVVKRLEDHSRTVRYQPVGDPADWQIGEPYVPHETLKEISEHVPSLLKIVVAWDFTSPFRGFSH